MTRNKELNFGMRCIKYMLCMSNLMFVTVGLLLISIGCTVKTIYKNFDQFMEAHYYNPSTLAIAIGFIIFIVAMFGCVGAFRESTCLVNTYAFFLTLILVLEISVSIAAYAMRGHIHDSMEKNMQVAMENFNIDYNAYTWNTTQYNLQCCGIHKNTEWSYYKDRYFHLTIVPMDDNGTSFLYVPATCCVNEKCSASTIYSDGCLNRLSSIVSQCALLLAVGSLCVSFIQVLGIVFASMLGKSIRKCKTQMLVDREERRRNFYDQMVKNEEEMKNKTKSPMLYTPKDSDV